MQSKGWKAVFVSNQRPSTSTQDLELVNCTINGVPDKRTRKDCLAAKGTIANE
jgi:hypothetical protein